MRMIIRAVVLAVPCVLALAPLTVVALADDERPRSTVSRPVDVPKKELVLLVGGLDSRASDRTWDAMVGRFSVDPRYEVRRFGALPEHPYRTDGSVDANARELIAEVRELQPSYSAIHLVAHSMGGAVVDRAFAQGLSSDDGVRTYVSMSAPHSGSTAAMAGQTVLDAAGPDAGAIRGVLAAAWHDPDSPAARELAHMRSARAPAGVARLDVRLANDFVVLSGDATMPDVATRTLLPDPSQDPLELVDGHGRILADRRALEMAAATISTGAAPADDRGRSLVAAVALVDLLVTTAFVLACVCVGVLLVAARASGVSGPLALLRGPLLDRLVARRG